MESVGLSLPKGHSKPSAGQFQCGQLYGTVDPDSGEVFAGLQACYRRDCPSCGPKRTAEDMERIRLRLEGWQIQKRDGVGFVDPVFVTVSQDPQQIPFEERSEPHRGEGAIYVQACQMEEAGFRRRVSEMLRHINTYERRAGRVRVEYVGCVERGPRNGTLHVHLIVDRVIRVELWRQAAHAAGIIGGPGRGGRAVDVFRVEGGTRGAAAYLGKVASYIAKADGDLRPKGARVLLHSRGAIPSLPLWRAIRASGMIWTAADVAEYWNVDGLRELAAKYVTSRKAAWRENVTERAEGGAVVVRRTREGRGWRSERVSTITGPKAAAAAREVRKAEQLLLEVDGAGGLDDPVQAGRS